MEQVADAVAAVGANDLEPASVLKGAGSWEKTGRLHLPLASLWLPGPQPLLSTPILFPPSLRQAQSKFVLLKRGTPGQAFQPCPARPMEVWKWVHRLAWGRLVGVIPLSDPDGYKEADALQGPGRGKLTSPTGHSRSYNRESPLAAPGKGQGQGPPLPMPPGHGNLHDCLGQPSGRVVCCRQAVFAHVTDG